MNTITTVVGSQAGIEQVVLNLHHETHYETGVLPNGQYFLKALQAFLPPLPKGVLTN